MDVEIKIVAERVGKRHKVMVKRGDEVLHADEFEVIKAKPRKQFVADVKAILPAVKTEDLDAELLQLADESEPAIVPVREVDVSRIVRPEQFFTPEVSGLAVPIIVEMGGAPVGQWHLHLRWDDGRREVVELRSHLDLGNSRKLWVHPLPGTPALNTTSQWSRESRRIWQRSEATADPVKVFQGLCERIVYFLDLREDSAKGTTATIALWSIMTYVFQAWDAVPYLNIGGPMGSGKSRLLSVLARLVFRPVNSSNLTGPALFRTLHDRGGVLLYDEAEGLRASTPEAGELLSMLLAGYKRGGQATRLEAVGDSYRPVAFDVYGPKALAGIAGLPPTLASRSIPVTMFRAGPDSDKPKRRLDEDPASWQRLRDELHVVAVDHGPTWRALAERDDVCPAAINGRQFELWQPLLALAWWIESRGAKGLLDLMQQHALQAITASNDDAVPEADEVLLTILTEAVKTGQWVCPNDILATAQEREPNIFGRPNSAGPRWQSSTVARRLKTYGLETRKANGKRTYRHVTLAQLLKIQHCYSIDLDIPLESPTLPTLSDPADPDNASMPAPQVLLYQGVR